MTPIYADVIRQTENMVRDAESQRLAADQGLQILNVTWEDTSRFKGSAVGPNLTDGEWLHNDGTLQGFMGTIKSGVPQPKKAPAPMPPMGGASLIDEQVKAVATYVHSLGGGK